MRAAAVADVQDRCIISWRNAFACRVFMYNLFVLLTLWLIYCCWPNILFWKPTIPIENILIAHFFRLYHQIRMFVVVLFARCHLSSGRDISSVVCLEIVSEFSQKRRIPTWSCKLPWFQHKTNKLYSEKAGVEDCRVPQLKHSPVGGKLFVCQKQQGNRWHLNKVDKLRNNKTWDKSTFISNQGKCWNSLCRLYQIHRSQLKDWVQEFISRSRHG